MFTCFKIRYTSVVLLLFLISCTQSIVGEDEARILASSAIVLARVESRTSEPVSADPFGGIFLATLSIESAIADEGGLEDFHIRSVSVPFRPSMSHSIDFVVGRQYLVYLAFCWNGPRVVGDFLGAIQQGDESSILMPNKELLDFTSARATYEPFFSDERRAERAVYHELVCGRLDPTLSVPLQ